MSKKARRNYIKAVSQRVDRKKMYKAKKNWVVAGMSFLVAMGLGALTTGTSHASTNTDSHNNQQTTQVKKPNNNQVKTNQTNKSNTTNNNSLSSIKQSASNLHNSILNSNQNSKTSIHNNSASKDNSSNSNSNETSHNVRVAKNSNQLVNPKVVIPSAKAFQQSKNSNYSSVNTSALLDARNSASTSNKNSNTTNGRTSSLSDINDGSINVGKPSLKKVGMKLNANENTGTQKANKNENQIDDNKSRDGKNNDKLEDINEPEVNASILNQSTWPGKLYKIKNGNGNLEINPSDMPYQYGSKDHRIAVCMFNAPLDGSLKGIIANQSDEQQTYYSTDGIVDEDQGDEHPVIIDFNQIYYGTNNQIWVHSVGIDPISPCKSTGDAGNGSLNSSNGWLDISSSPLNNNKFVWTMGSGLNNDTNYSTSPQTNPSDWTPISKSAIAASNKTDPITYHYNNQVVSATTQSGKPNSTGTITTTPSGWNLTNSDNKNITYNGNPINLNVTPIKQTDKINYVEKITPKGWLPTDPKTGWTKQPSDTIDEAPAGSGYHIYYNRDTKVATITGNFNNYGNYGGPILTNNAQRAKEIDLGNAKLSYNVNSMFQGDQSLTTIKQVGNWDTSNVTNMWSMFQGDTQLTNIQGLSNWNTQSVTNMKAMFESDDDIKDLKPLSTWNTNKVTNMSGMFYEASHMYNSTPLYGWHFNSMGTPNDSLNSGNGGVHQNGASIVPHNLPNSDVYINGNIYKIISIISASGNDSRAAQAGNNSFKVGSDPTSLPLSDTVNNPNQVIGYDGQTHNVIITPQNTVKNTVKIDYSDNSTKKHISDTINGAVGRKVNLNNYIKSNLPSNYTINGQITINGKKVDASDAKITIENPVSNYGKAYAHYNPATKTLELSGDLSKYGTQGGVKSSGQNFSNLDNNIPSNWNNVNTLKFISNTELPTDCNGMFGSMTNLNAIITSKDAHVNTNKVTNMVSMFQNDNNLSNIQGLADWNTSKVSDMTRMFENDSSLSNIQPLTKWNINKVHDMEYMFFSDHNLSNIQGLTKWDTNKVTDMNNMFYGDNLNNTQGLINWNTSNVTNMQSMFENNYKLSNIQGLNNWNVSKVSNMESMFESDNLSILQPLASWNTSNTVDMIGMFQNNNNLNNIQGLTNWDTNAVSDIRDMFESDHKLSNIKPLANWNTRHITETAGTFQNDSNLADHTPISGWSIDNNGTPNNSMNDDFGGISQTGTSQLTTTYNYIFNGTKIGTGSRPIMKEASVNVGTHPEGLSSNYVTINPNQQVTAGSTNNINIVKVPTTNSDNSIQNVSVSIKQTTNYDNVINNIQNNSNTANNDNNIANIVNNHASDASESTAIANDKKNIANYSSAIHNDLNNAINDSQNNKASDANKAGQNASSEASDANKELNDIINQNSKASTSDITRNNANNSNEISSASSATNSNYNHKISLKSSNSADTNENNSINNDNGIINSASGYIHSHSSNNSSDASNDSKEASSANSAENDAKNQSSIANDINSIINSNNNNDSNNNYSNEINNDSKVTNSDSNSANNFSANSSDASESNTIKSDKNKINSASNYIHTHSAINSSDANNDNNAMNSANSAFNDAKDQNSIASAINSVSKSASIASASASSSASNSAKSNNTAVYSNTVSEAKKNIGNLLNQANSIASRSDIKNDSKSQLANGVSNASQVVSNDIASITSASNTISSLNTTSSDASKATIALSNANSALANAQNKANNYVSDTMYFITHPSDQSNIINGKVVGTTTITGFIGERENIEPQFHNDIPYGYSFSAGSDWFTPQKGGVIPNNNTNKKVVTNEVVEFPMIGASNNSNDKNNDIFVNPDKVTYKGQITINFKQGNKRITSFTDNYNEPTKVGDDKAQLITPSKVQLDAENYLLSKGYNIGNFKIASDSNNQTSYSDLTKFFNVSSDVIQNGKDTTINKNYTLNYNAIPGTVNISYSDAINNDSNEVHNDSGSATNFSANSSDANESNAIRNDKSIINQASSEINSDSKAPNSNNAQNASAEASSANSAENDAKTNSEIASGITSESSSASNSVKNSIINSAKSNASNDSKNVQNFSNSNDSADKSVSDAINGDKNTIINLSNAIKNKNITPAQASSDASKANNAYHNASDENSIASESASASNSAKDANNKAMNNSYSDTINNDSKVINNDSNSANPFSANSADKDQSNAINADKNTISSASNYIHTHSAINSSDASNDTNAMNSTNSAYNDAKDQSSIANGIDSESASASNSARNANNQANDASNKAETNSAKNNINSDANSINNLPNSNDKADKSASDAINNDKNIINSMKNSINDKNITPASASSDASKANSAFNNAKNEDSIASQSASDASHVASNSNSANSVSASTAKANAQTNVANQLKKAEAIASQSNIKNDSVASGMNASQYVNSNIATIEQASDAINGASDNSNGVSAINNAISTANSALANVENKAQDYVTNTLYFINNSDNQLINGKVVGTANITGFIGEEENIEPQFVNDIPYGYNFPDKPYMFTPQIGGVIPDTSNNVSETEPMLGATENAPTTQVGESDNIFVNGDPVTYSGTIHANFQLPDGTQLDKVDVPYSVNTKVGSDKVQLDNPSSIELSVMNDLMQKGYNVNNFSVIKDSVYKALTNKFSVDPSVIPNGASSATINKDYNITYNANQADPITINYTDQNGKKFTNNVNGFDYQKGNDITKLDNHFPAGYHLTNGQNANYEFGVGKDNLNLKITGNTINPNHNNASDQVAVTIKENGKSVAQGTKVGNYTTGANGIVNIPETGQVGNTYTVDPKDFTPTGYTAQGTAQTGVFTANGISNKAMTFNFNANQGATITVNLRLLRVCNP